MSVILLLITAGALIAAGFLVAFAWAVESGQFDDTVTPALRILDPPSPGASPAHDEHHEPDPIPSPSSKENHVH